MSRSSKEIQICGQPKKGLRSIALISIRSTAILHMLAYEKLTFIAKGYGGSELKSPHPSLYNSIESSFIKQLCLLSGFLTASFAYAAVHQATMPQEHVDLKAWRARRARPKLKTGNRN